MGLRLLIPLVLSLRMFAITYPELPRATVDATMPPITGITQTVNCTGGVGDATDLQNKLNAAVGGDAVVLPHGCVWTGHFILPVHSGSGYVVVMTDALSSLPSPGTRVSPLNVSSMARLQLPAGYGQGAVLSNDYQNPDYSARASAWWRFSGLEIAAPSAVPFTYSLVTLDATDDSGNGSAAGLPEHIVFDRVWVHADTLTTMMQRAFRANAAYFAVVDSYINQIQAPSAPFAYAAETQAICAWNSPGPFTIVNNYLEASTENTMFGGAFGSQTAWTASDITFQHNYVSKNPAWAPGGTTVWYTKNLFELKEGVRVLVTDNVFDYSWAGAQNGFAMTIVPRTAQSGWWKNITDVVVSSNVIRHVGGFLSTQAQDDDCASLNQSSVVNIYGTTVTWVGGATLGPASSYGASFTVNGSGSYQFTWTSPTTGTISQDLGVVQGAAFVLICNSQDRVLYVNNLIDDVNESYGPASSAIQPSGLNDFAIRNNSMIRSDSSGRPSFFFPNPGCWSGTQDLGNNLLIRYNLLVNTVNADCLIDPNAIFPLATGSVNVDHNLLANLGSVDQARWTTWDPATRFSASVATLELTADHTAFASGSPFSGSGLGPNLSCFNEAAVIAGAPSALCPLPNEVAPQPILIYQTITFGVLSNVTAGTTPVTISATASSGLPVSFTSTTMAVCTVSVSTVTIWAAGTCSIVASQSGDINFSAAASVTQGFTVDASFRVNAPGLTNSSGLGIFRSSGGSGIFCLDLNQSTYNYAPTTAKFTLFGLPGDQPVAGDWDGTGVVRIGVFRQGAWYIDVNNNGVWDGVAGGDAIYYFGLPGDIAIPGDWNGTGVTKLGVFRCPNAPAFGGCNWYLDAGNKKAWDPATAEVYSYGLSGDLPVVNNWNGAGADQIGVFRCPPASLPGLCYWIVDNVGDGVYRTTDPVYQYGLTGDLPVVGNWSTGPQRKRIGVYRNGSWILETLGTNAYSPADAVAAFGQPGDLPVTGNWTIP